MKTRILVASVLLAVAGLASSSFAHCDALDGPVVRAGREALDKGDLTSALIWVKSADEKELRGAFDKALAVRGLGTAARDLADTYFLETLVRVHRAGEGEPFTGLKPAGAIPPGIALADKSIASGDVDALVKEVTAGISAGIRARFTAVMAARRHVGDTTAAGREYVAAYVAFIHQVEALVSSVHAQESHTAAPAHAH